MSFVRIRAAEGCERVPNLLWDTIWVERIDASGGYGDWVLADIARGDQPESAGGLRAEAALHTATMIQLFTDARAPDGETIPDESGNRRGWWGDSIKLEGEPDGETGSLIWLEVTRAVLSDTTARAVRDHAADALATLADQGAVARTEVETEAHRDRGLLTLLVRHYDAAGGEIYARRFAVVWDEAGRNAQMNFGDVGAF